MNISSASMMSTILNMSKPLVENRRWTNSVVSTKHESCEYNSLISGLYFQKVNGLQSEFVIV